jgi:hypothetical protein
MLINPASSAPTQKPRNNALKPAESPKREASRGLLDTFRGRYDKLDIHLDQPEYQNVPDLAAAKMLGHFTQTMQNQGYPWRLHAAEPDGDKGFKKGATVSDMEALARLKKGEALLLQPMRDLQLDPSSGSLTAVATAGTLAGGQLAPLGTVADYSKNTQVSAGSQGLSLKFGEPLVINSFAELKLLNQMYDSDQKIQGASTTAKAAHQLSYFTQKTVGSAYPWRFYTKDDGNTALRVAKSTSKGLASGAAVGAAMAGAVGALLAMGFRNIDYLWGAAAIGASLGAAKGGYDAAQTSLKGNPINAVEALERVLSNEEVVFQESRARSIGLPIVGKIAWFADQGKGSSINSIEDLNTFYYMQSGAELPKAPEPKKEEKPAPTVLVLDQSVHHHYQNNRVSVFSA